MLAAYTEPIGGCLLPFILKTVMKPGIALKHETRIDYSECEKKATLKSRPWLHVNSLMSGSYINVLVIFSFPSQISYQLGHR
jgi:hypothetical protein